VVEARRFAAPFFALRALLAAAPLFAAVLRAAPFRAVALRAVFADFRLAFLPPRAALAAFFARLIAAVAAFLIFLRAATALVLDFLLLAMVALPWSYRDWCRSLYTSVLDSGNKFAPAPCCL
jgi:hypothetical protein